MKYPTIKRGTVQELTLRRLQGEELFAEDVATMAGAGEEVELPDLESLSAELKRLLEEHQTGLKSSDADKFEGQASVFLWRVLSVLPANVLDDPGFWAFLSLTNLWWMVHWRESEAFTKMPATYLKYVNGQQPAECVLSRMYLRGQIANLTGDDSLAWKSDQAADFWRSHLVRVGTGSIPALAGAFLRSQSNDRMPTDELRQLAKRVNRLKTNVIADIYDEPEADALLAELRSNR